MRGIKKPVPTRAFISGFFASIIVLRSLGPSLPTRLQDTLTLALGVIYEALPFVALGVLLSVVVQLYVPEDRLFRILPKRAFLRRPLLASVGSVLPVCECGNVPLARGLMIKGLTPHEVLTFLFAAPIINPVTIYTTIQAFPADHRVVVIRVLAAFLIAMLVGAVFAKEKKSAVITDSFQHHCDTHHEPAKQHTIRHRIVHFAKQASEEFSLLLPSLFTGSLIAGVIQTSIPRSILTVLADNPLLAILAMLALAFIVSICANVDAFFALSLSGIFPVSAIIAFLVFGPMVDIKMLALLRTTFTPTLLLKASLLIFLCSLLTGLVVAYAL